MNEDLPDELKAEKIEYYLGEASFHFYFEFLRWTML